MPAHCPDRRLLALLVSCLIPLSSGCADPSPAPPADDGGQETASSPPDAEVPISVRVIDETGFAEVIGQHRGKVVFVDFWATWCGECVELLPHSADLQRKFADRGLAVVLVSLNEPDEEAAVRKVLAKHEVTFESFISRYGSQAKSYEVFRITGGALPHFKLFDRQGKLHSTFASASEAIDTDQIDQAVEELLDQ